MNNKQRFSDRVDDYIKYRPSYPTEIIHFLSENLGLKPESFVADIGSGTGISTELFLKNGNRVYAVEPNPEMRQAAESLLVGYKNFTSVNASAEETNLPSNSVDFIIAAQAFHWFNLPLTQQEFQRILKSNGNILLLWNSRSTDNAFQQAYEDLLWNNIESYKNMNHRGFDDAVIEHFFAPREVGKARFNNFQEFDLEGMKGRLLSSSYCPKSGEIHHLLMQQLELLFSQYAENGLVRFHYQTVLYYCKPA